MSFIFTPPKFKLKYILYLLVILINYETTLLFVTILLLSSSNKVFPLMILFVTILSLVPFSNSIVLPFKILPVTIFKPVVTDVLSDDILIP